MTLAMTLSFAGIFARGIKLKNVAKTPYLTLGLTLEMTLGFGRHLKAEMSVLTRVADRLQKINFRFLFLTFSQELPFALRRYSNRYFFYWHGTFIEPFCCHQ
jgi:hypothetical protein